ncbi:helix-turn-helix domain-containing protein [Methanorbis rubei]|uniref:Uncharacterized protein n=1 Tax=Methanorbis rubei TaxID=3028300 RepID=A0AAE4SCU4_9EURY|nr:hypothetical protein [Methanocorpusculaceae archaeon Cs1]
MRWYQYPELADRAALMELLRAGMSVKEICQHVGCTKTAVASAMLNHGIHRPFVDGVTEELKRRLRL